MKNIIFFYLIFFLFFGWGRGVVKFSIYLNRHVFIMVVAMVLYRIKYLHDHYMLVSNSVYSANDLFVVFIHSLNEHGSM